MKLLDLVRGTATKQKRDAANDALDEVEDLMALVLETADRITRRPPPETEQP